MKVQVHSSHSNVRDSEIEVGEARRMRIKNLSTVCAAPLPVPLFHVRIEIGNL